MKPHRRLRRGRRPVRDTRPLKGRRHPPPVGLAGVEVLVVGYFSARQQRYAALMDELADTVTALGARVVGRSVQRRGVSDGGVKAMDRPYSSRTLVSAGKAREIACARAETGAGAVVFLNPLTDHQRNVLAEILGCPVLSAADLRPPPSESG
ncbi:hypothetical protein AB0J63_34295 [Streptosporangium canum]|uniref:HflX-like GTP-binding protein n=1 Tax=Streptosporangium canum TaxID=324952 RepID=UPI00342C1073